MAGFANFTSYYNARVRHDCHDITNNRLAFPRRNAIIRAGTLLAPQNVLVTLRLFAMPA